MTLQKTKPVLVFDVNETLLDMTPLKKSVNALLDNEQGSASGLAHYYTTPLYRIVSTSIMTLVLLRNYISYGTSMNRKVDEDEIKEALSTIKTLQAYPDVEKGLQLLKDNGFRLTLTNSPSCAKAAVNQFKFNRLF
jgi:2-haloacid dehalogenase